MTILTVSIHLKNCTRITFKPCGGFRNSYLKDKEQAMDATQEAFFKLYERLNDSYTKQNAVAFIYITAKNICMDILRRNKFTIEDAEKLKEELPSEDSFLEEIATQEMIRCVHAAISQLSGAYSRNRHPRIRRQIQLGNRNHIGYLP